MAKTTKRPTLRRVLRNAEREDRQPANAGRDRSLEADSPRESREMVALVEYIAPADARRSDARAAGSGAPRGRRGGSGAGLAAATTALAIVSDVAGFVSLVSFGVAIQQRSARAARWGFFSLAVALAADVGRTCAGRAAIAARFG